MQMISGYITHAISPEGIVHWGFSVCETCADRYEELHCLQDFCGPCQKTIEENLVRITAPCPMAGAKRRDVNGCEKEGGD